MVSVGFSIQELDLIKGNNALLPLFGLNSSGKTSFVDGIEWFLSEENKIEWLRRDEAEEKAYHINNIRSKGWKVLLKWISLIPMAKSES